MKRAWKNVVLWMGMVAAVLALAGAIGREPEESIVQTAGRESVREGMGQTEIVSVQPVMAESIEATGQMEGEETEQTEKELTPEEKELTASLYARAAVLLDMDSGRVLYEKNGTEILPMATTTKIMTCILALEECGREEIVTVSAYAAGQPKVHLGMQKGTSYQMDDLLHSLMLESHNDSAVAIAEYIGGKELNLPEAGERTKEESKEAVKVFCDKMTEKAREIGCNNTCFLTPNGLDAQVQGTDGEELVHSTTAEDLARIMRYCVTQSRERDTFLEITRTQSCSFTDTSGKRSHSCNNHNAFLTMMEGALSGKTGFTNQAGYCYVGALEQGEKRFALALLACGWPNHKTWKWSDSKKLFTYGLEQYEYREFIPETELTPILVVEGASEDGNPWREVSVIGEVSHEILPIRLLIKQGENIVAQVDMVKKLEAPVEKGMQVGTISYYLTDGQGNRKYIAQETIYAGADVDRKDFYFYIRFIGKRYLL